MMIILKCIKRIFRTWFRKTFFGLPFFIFLIAGVQSCSSGKNMPVENASPDSHPDSMLKIPADPSIAPNRFRADASLLNARVAEEKMMYTFLIENVLERGSSLIYMVAKGDSINATSDLSSIRLQKNDQVNIVIEERMQLNAVIPLFIVRSIRKK
jgi:hypothetical protein